MKKLISLSRQTRRLCLRFSKRISKLAIRNAEAGGISTTDLVNKIYTFCEVYSGITLYKYQTQFSKRIIRSVLENDGAELTALFARQSGKTETISVTVGGLMIILPQLANMPMFADDKRLTTYKVGFWVGIFAPNLRQSQITFRRMKSRMQSKEALAVLNDPEFRLEYSTSNGQTVALSNGSYVTAISASDGSSIEGETFMFIIIEECQDVSNYKIRKSIHPMGAAYKSTICKIGTPTTFKGDFYETIERNKKEFKEGKLRVRNHFEYDYKVVEKYNPKYAKYVEREKRSLGENSDEFAMSYRLQWVISRGMFVDITKFERDCGDELLDLVSSDLFSDHVAGIDIGGGSSSNSQEADSTEITIVEVDWDSPAILEHTIDEETNEDIVYEAYNTYVKAWIEISPEVARDYNEQYVMIMEVLSRFKIRKAFIDATREASLAQRVAANVKFPVVPFVFSTKSKSEMYKNLDREINSARLHFPASKEAKDTKEYDKFIFQFANLQKGYSGSNMIVSHPAERGAHDDYCDSLALAILASRERGQIDETETQSRNDVFRGQQQSSRYGMRNSRNNLTARRRA